MQRIRAATFIVVVTLLALVIALPLTLTGQNETIVTIAIPAWMSDTFSGDLFDEFVQQHPGVKVVSVSDENGYLVPAAYDLDQHFEQADAYFSKADVLFFSSNSISPVTTRAGYVLDLAPLIESDPEMNTSDFFPAIWQSYQWDRGIWAIPASASVQLLIYDKNAFDEAGLAYPDDTWSIADLISAAQALTIYDENGNVELPGVTYLDPGAMLYGATGDGLYDESQLPSPPDFSNPLLPEILQEWMDFQETIRIEGPYEYDQVPIQTNGVWMLENASGFGGSDRDWHATLMPGGVASMYIQSFAISAGTEHPELAYELVKFLTSNATAVNRIYGDVPARQSLVNAESEDQYFFRQELSDEAQAVLDLAVERAVPSSELRFSDYLFAAMNGESDDMASQIAEAEQNALNALAEADNRRANLQVFVSTPVPTPSFGADEIVISFGLNGGSSELPNQELWDSTISKFVADHPRVGNVDLVTQMYGPSGQVEVDCYYSYYNEIGQELNDVARYLNLDPFMDADPTFDPNDFLGDTLQRMQRDNRTYGYPLTLQPNILWYDQVRFDDANLVSPEGGWSIEAFNDALSSLRSLGNEDDPVFSPQTFSGSYILMLVAAYGGIPYDRSTSPATFNLTDPDTVDAIRQVLDLARDGYIDYQELSNFSGGGGFFGGPNEPPISTDVLNGFSWRLQNRAENDFYANFRLTHYPRGSRYIPLAYDVGSAYILAESRDPEACYDFISTIAHVPGLFSGVPATQTMVNDPTVSTSQGEDVANLYVTFAEDLTQPDVLIFPGDYGPGGDSYGSFLEPQWMYDAFDNYVLEGADLEEALTLAQENIMTYRECTSAIEEIDTSQFEDDPESAQAYFKQFIDCGVAITPELRDVYSFYYQDEE